MAIWQIPLFCRKALGISVSGKQKEKTLKKIYFLLLIYCFLLYTVQISKWERSKKKSLQFLFAWKILPFISLSSICIHDYIYYYVNILENGWNIHFISSLSNYFSRFVCLLKYEELPSGRPHNLSLFPLEWERVSSISLELFACKWV
jgi:hypothetical protein